MPFNVRTVAVAATVALASWGAQATSYVYGLSGALADAQVSTFDNGGTRFDQWHLPLTGLDAGNEAIVQAGDTFRALITLDAPLTVPTSGNLTFYTFALGGSGFDGNSVGTSGQFSLKLAGVTLAGSSSNCGTSSQIAFCWVFLPPANATITFDEVLMDINIDTLAVPATVNSASFNYSLFSPSAVPEPMSSSLLLAGLAGLAWKRRRAR